MILVLALCCYVFYPSVRLPWARPVWAVERKVNLHKLMKTGKCLSVAITHDGWMKCPYPEVEYQLLRRGALLVRLTGSIWFSTGWYRMLDSMDFQADLARAFFWSYWPWQLGIKPPCTICASWFQVLIGIKGQWPFRSCSACVSFLQPHFLDRAVSEALKSP